jgi:hypothetical protein
MDNDATWYVGLVGKPGTVFDDVPTVLTGKEWAIVSITARWGAALCRTEPLVRGELSNCPNSAYRVHSVPSLTWRNAVVPGWQQSLNSQMKTRSNAYCDGITRNYSCAYWIPICDDQGFKLPPCVLMCYTMSTNCFPAYQDNVGVINPMCGSGAGDKCTGFPTPPEAAGSGALLAIVLIAVLLGIVVIGVVVGYFRKKKIMRDMERSSAEASAGAVPDQFNITAGPTFSPPVLHSAVIEMGPQPAVPKNVRTFESTRGWDHPSASESSSESSDPGDHSKPSGGAPGSVTPVKR